jgi:hypothetical protein
MSLRFFTRMKCSVQLRFFRAQALARNSSTDMESRTYTVALAESGSDTLIVFSVSSREFICSDLLLDPLLDLDSSGGRLLVAPRPASKLFRREGLLAQMKAWNEETVNTPSLFKVFFVALDTCVSKDWKDKVNQLGAPISSIDSVVEEKTSTFRTVMIF